MGKGVAKFQLAGYNEHDDAFFEIGDPHQKPNKTGRGTTGRVGVLVAVASLPTENRFRRKSRKESRKCNRRYDKINQFERLLNTGLQYLWC